MGENLIEIRDLHKRFPVTGGILGREVAAIHAVRGVSLEIARGETLGLVGESGCGKSTLGQMMLRLLSPDEGRIVFDGRDITRLSHRELRPLRSRMQMIFQDPFASLNPRMTAGDIVAEPLIVNGIGSRSDRGDRVVELMRLVGLSAESCGRYPHEFSGGQRQRIGIARAIALTPSFIIADEPVSALDLSIRGEILNLLSDLRERFSLTYLFIAHDLKVVENISRRVAVMYLGRIMEIFPADRLAEARHPYTQALVSAVPVPDPAPTARSRRMILMGDVPSQMAPPPGCPFHPRCPYAERACGEEEPPLSEYRPGLSAACRLIEKMESRRVGLSTPAFSGGTKRSE
ncbi:MAG: ABC transporter ATP-binding protein [Proteobacteria bacterium]|nr:ABC transporter ATP-binding protein [Pseudomonadota bacterium]